MQAKYETHLKQHLYQLIAKVEAALKEAAQRVDLDEANAIKAKLDEIRAFDITAPSGESQKTTAPPRKRPVSPKIPRDAISFAGHHYYVPPVGATWHVAKEICEESGGHLVRIESPAEQQFVYQLVAPLNCGVVFIDGTDEREEGKWILSDGTPMQYANWGPKSPNNTEDSEHWAVMNITARAAGTWDDKRGCARQRFVCEWDR